MPSIVTIITIRGATDISNELSKEACTLEAK